MFCCVTLFDLFRLLLIFTKIILLLLFYLAIIFLWKKFNFLCSGMIRFRGCISTPDKDKVEECNKCTTLAIHTFAKCDH